MAQVLETSNNDRTTTATSLGQIRSNPFVNGSFSTTDNVDFFQFQVDVPAKVGMTVIPQGVDANLRVLDGSGALIKESANGGTAADSLNLDNLLPGNYFIQVQKATTGSGTYILSASGIAVSRAQLSVSVDRVTALQRFDTRIPGTTFGEADFIVKAIQADPGGANRVEKSSTSGNRDDVNLNNFTLTRDVNINQRLLFASINVSDNDPDPDLDDIADLSPSPGNAGIFLDYDIVKGQIIPKSSIIGQSPSFSGPKREGEIITAEGDGKDSIFEVKRARISFRVNYETFVVNQPALNTSIPLIRGSGTVIGQNIGGILCGEEGNDTLSGLGGNDILCGDAGDDTLEGGTGRDISFGGAGRDRHYGGRGRDIFVLSLDSGVDIIHDFQNGKDALGLPLGLGAEALTIEQRNQNTVIGVGDRRLAILANTKASQITTEDFVAIGFTGFKGIDIPTLVS